MSRTVADWLYRYRWWPWVVTLPLLPAMLWPASWWFDVRKIYIADVRVGTDIPIVIDRTIKRPFHANWSVSIRQWDAGWTVHCVANGEQTYKPDARLPKAPTLRWWTWDRCHPLPPGRYEVVTTWRLDIPYIWATKHVEISSNVFEVSE